MSIRTTTTETTVMNTFHGRAGYFVNGRRFSADCRAQAIARASFLATEYGRNIAVVYKAYDGNERIEYTAKPSDENSMRCAILAVM
jgi:hypothetical protein